MLRRPRTHGLLLVAALLAIGCGGPGFASPRSVAPASPSVTPGPSPAASTSPSPDVLGQVELKIRLVDRFGPLWYCDPDFWPVARQDEQALAISRWPELSADRATIEAIGSHLGIALSPPPSDEGKLAIYREWKMLRAIALDPVEADRYRFDYLSMPSGGAPEGTRSKGTIDARGAVVIDSATAAAQPNCPICLARGQLIETPSGSVPVETLRLGDPVWTLDAAGARRTSSVIALGSAAVPPGHRVVRLNLADGRSLVASPGHPLPDGRRLGDLHRGDAVQGSIVARAELEPYPDGETFDLLAAGQTGSYAIDGIWLASTLWP